MRPELGTKRECPNCDAKFYDLNRNPAACPKCGYTLAAEMATPRAKPPRPAKVEAVAAAAKPKPDAAPIKSLDDDDDEALALDDDTESLEELEGDDVDVEDGNGDGEQDAFLEADDEAEGGDVTDIIGGRSADEEER